MFPSSEIEVDKTDGCAKTLASQVSMWWMLESHAPFVVVQSRYKSGKQALIILNETCHMNCSLYSLEMLWQAEDTELPSNFGQIKTHLLENDYTKLRNSILLSETIR